MSFPRDGARYPPALEGVDIRLEQAARTLGAGRWRVFLTITLAAYVTGHYRRYGVSLRPLVG